MSQTAPVLDISDLRIAFSTKNGVAEVVNSVNLRVEAGRMHGLVGESGSGKSVTARSVLGILPRQNLIRKTGSILLDGEEIIDYSEEQMRNTIRGKTVSMVFQDPMTALNPVMRLGRQLTNPLRRHFGFSERKALAQAVELLEQVGIPRAQERLRSFPHELSGGQRQRVMIAIALACSPKLLIADEPTTALDVTVQAQILDLFDQLRRERNLSILLVSHDLGLIAERCDEVSVMYGGEIIETGPAKHVFAAPDHPYTRLLEAARPSLANPPHTMLKVIPGRPPNLVDLPMGCSFASRCPRATELCVSVAPHLTQRVPDRRAACHYPLLAADGGKPTVHTSSNGAGY